MDCNTENGVAEKINKRFKLIYFVIKALLVAVVAFMVIGAVTKIWLGNDIDETDNGYNFAGHTYCGTFFIETTKENSYVSDEAYQEALENILNSDMFSVEQILYLVPTVVVVILLILVFRKCSKNQFFDSKVSKMLIISGVLMAFGNVFVQVISRRDLNAHLHWYKGVLAGGEYYCQLYNVLGLPMIMIGAGLIIHQHELGLRDKNQDRNSRGIKAFSICVTVIGGGFLLYRFAVRVYELVMVLLEKDVVVRLPFYHQTLELPLPLAKSYDDYSKVVGFRFIKDLPVFIASGLAIFMFVRVLWSVAGNEINTDKNRRRIWLSIIVLVVSSLAFNLLGLIEVKLLNIGFTGIYSQVEYTIGMRGECEPIIFAFGLWVFGSFIKTVLKKD